MSVRELYTKGARVWLPDPDRVWRAVTVLTNYDGKGQLQVTSPEGGNETIPIKSDSDLPPLRNPEILIGQKDLTALSYLNEPEVLYNLESRFNKSQIYTKCGIVLVAINPYEVLSIYGNDTIQLYRDQDVQLLEPHIFATAELAYQSMINFSKNQSIIVSGESGAGKTVSAKYAMRYFANVGGLLEETQIEKKVLASNPIMEAIGNAKTIRNDNSSRFGKYIEIGFLKHHICGASMRTYLLEKSRVIYQANDERNYHIFYQLCSQANQSEMKSLVLLPANQFRYTSEGNAIIIKGVDDAQQFFETREALTLLGIENKLQMSIFRLLSGILHLGNVIFDEGENESTFVKQSDKSFSIFCSLLKLDENRMRTWLCHKRIKTGVEVVNTTLNLNQALFARDALAKHIYSQLFGWIVDEINKSLEYIGQRQSFIGVLDIYGFETFQMNSFEQFCINYANEKLQQQFCQHVFKLEQEEYMKEEITWSFIEFYDNQPCIDLIESKLGILDLLDEECKMPKGSDENWNRKLVTQHGKHPDFLTKKLAANSTFIINHFAEKVEYSIDGFLEKNRDTVLEDQLKMLKESELDFVVQLFLEEDDTTNSSKTSTKSYQVQKTGTLQATSKIQAQRKKTVGSQRLSLGSQFRESLTSLMSALNSTEPHYVRCIKPNDKKAPFTFEPRRAVEQLRACGVLETVRISAAGYPSRWTYYDFFVRYRLLSRSSLIDRTNYRRTCENILKTLISDPDKFQFGNTKIFFRAGQVAYLEKLRSEKLRACIIKIQTTYRGYYARKRYLKIRRTTLALQTLGRRYLAKKHAEQIRRTRAITLYQSLWRMQLAYRQFQTLRLIIIDIQSRCRGYLVRKNLQQRMLERNVLVLQSTVRMWIARRKYLTFQRGIILLQSHQRRREACLEVKQLRVEQRSIEHQRQLNKGLENKIISLQHKIDEQKRDNERLLTKEQEFENMKKEFEQLKINNKEFKNNLKKQTTLQEELQQLRAENERLKSDNASMRLDLTQTKQLKDEIILKNNEIIHQLQNDIENKTKEIQKLNEQLRGDLSTQDLSLTRVKQLEEELNTERQQRQRLVIEMHRLEQKCENLQSELQNGNINKPKQAPSDSNMTWDSKFMDTLDLDDLPDQPPLNSDGLTPRRPPPFLSSTINSHQRHLTTTQTNEVLDELGETGGGGLLLRLQRRLRQLEQENKTMNEELDKGITSSTKLGTIKKSSLWHLDELEMDKLKNDLKALREQVLKGDEKAAKEQLLAQFDALNAELEHRRREQIEMKSKLQERVMQHENETDDVIATDAIEQAYQSQKQINKMLELELEQCRTSYQREYERTQERLSQLETENIELCKSIDENTIDDSMKQQIESVIHENLELHQQIQTNHAEIRKLRRVIKLVNKSFSAGNVSWEQILQNGSTNGIPPFVDGSNSMSVTTTGANLPGNVDLRRQSVRHFSGMIKCTPQETERITDAVIIELKPRLAAKYLPGLPAYILFMCIRYIDFVDDEAHVAGFLSAVTKKIKKLPRRNEDIDYPILWTTNTVRFLHTLQQYSGEEKYQTTNTPKQNEQALRNFDLTDYRTIFADLVVHLYDEILKRIKAKLLPMIIPAIIEHEDLDSGGIGSGNPMASASISNDKRSKFSAQDLLKQLNDYHKLCQMYSVEPTIVQQLFRQIFYLIDAQALRGLLVRSDCCNWSKALQIRYNLNHLTEWLRDQNLQESGAADCLLPLTQAVQLFLCKKDEASISNVCTKLTIVQVTKLLSLYKSMDDFDDQVTPALIKRVSDLLKQQRLGSTTDQTRIDYEQQENFDLQYTFPLVYPYVPSTVSLDQLDIPHELHLDFLSLV